MQKKCKTQEKQETQRYKQKQKAKENICDGTDGSGDETHRYDASSGASGSADGSIQGNTSNRYFNIYISTPTHHSRATPYDYTDPTTGRSAKVLSFCSFFFCLLFSVFFFFVCVARATDIIVARVRFG